MDSNFMLTGFIVIIVIVVFVLIGNISNSTIDMKQIYAFKQVYEIETDLINIQIEILDKSNKGIVNITDYNDISLIIQEIANTKVKVLNGSINSKDYNKIKIINKDKEFVVALSPNKCIINGDEKTVYEFKNELDIKINKIIDKYINNVV